MYLISTESLEVFTSLYVNATKYEYVRGLLFQYREDVKMKIIYDPCVESLLILTELHVSRIKMSSIKSTINFYSIDPCKAHVIHELIKLGVKFPMYRIIGNISYPLNCNVVPGNN